MGQCIAYSTNKGREFIETDQEEWPHAWELDELVYNVVGVCRTLENKTVRKALNLAMTTWDIEVDVTFTPKWHRKNLYKPSHINIDFQDAEESEYFRNKPSVLAFAYFPGQAGVSGKVVFNNEYIWTMNGKPITGKEAKAKGWVNEGTADTTSIRTFSIINVLIHELGHSLGLKHDVSGNKDGVDVMDAFYDSNRMNLSERDIFRILLKYDRRIFSRWSHYGRLKKWLARKKASL